MHSAAVGKDTLDVLATSNIWSTLSGDWDFSMFIPLINEMLDPWRLRHYWEKPLNLLSMNLQAPQKHLLMLPAGPPRLSSTVWHLRQVPELPWTQNLCHRQPVIPNRSTSIPHSHPLCRRRDHFTQLSRPDSTKAITIQGLFLCLMPAM